MDFVPSRDARPRRLRLVAVLAALAAALAWPAAASPSTRSKIARDLRPPGPGSPPDAETRVIVQMDAPAVEAGRLKVRSLGGSPGRGLGLLHGFAATLPHDRIEELARDPRVRRISPDRKVRTFMEVAGPTSGAPQLLPPLGLRGAGVGIAVIDSGIFPHDDLPALEAFVDFIEPNSPKSRDRCGHGTHVAGVIAGATRADPGGSGLAFGGIAPGARLVSLRVLDENCEGYASDVIEAIQWAVDHREALGLRILNLSLGHPVAEPLVSDPLARAAEEAWLAGLVVVTSAGNLGTFGNGTITSPGNHPLVITVGASDDRGTVDPADDLVAPFSSSGPTLLDLFVKPDLLAPGHLITSLRSPLSTLDRSHPEARVDLDEQPGRAAGTGSGYFRMSGTSMAAGAVSAAAALLLEGDPGLTPDSVKARLMASARRAPGGTLFDRGAGALDLPAALAQGGEAGTALSPMVGEVDGEVALFHSPELWGGEPAWEPEELYGDASGWSLESIQENGFLDDPCVRGEGIVWQGLTGEGIVWQGLTGEGIVWQGLTGEGIVWQGVAQEGIVWQGVTTEAVCTSEAGRIGQGGIVWQGRSASGEGIVWQGLTGR